MPENYYYSRTEVEYFIAKELTSYLICLEAKHRQSSAAVAIPFAAVPSTETMPKIVEIVADNIAGCAHRPSIHHSD